MQSVHSEPLRQGVQSRKETGQWTLAEGVPFLATAAIIFRSLLVAPSREVTS